MIDIFGKIFRELGPVPPSAGVVTREPDGKKETGGKSGSYMARVKKADSYKTSLTIPAFHRAVELRSTTIGQLVIQYQKRSQLGKNFTPDLYGEGRRLNYLLQVRPNPLMSATALMTQAEIRRMMYGNAYIYIDRSDSGDVRALWLCESGSYDVLSDSYTITFMRPGTGMVTISECPSSSVIHLPNTFVEQGSVNRGISCLTFARMTLNISATNDQATLENAAKGGKMKILVQEDKVNQFGLGKHDPNQIAQLGRELEHDVYNQDVMVMSNAANAHVISQNAQQLQLLEQRGFSVSDIARITGVPRQLLMDDSNSSYKTPEASLQSFMTYQIQPTVSLMEDEFNAKLLSEADFNARRIHFCDTKLRRLDPAKQAELDKKDMEMGIKSVNELRGEHDLPVIEGGDAHYVSTNLAEVGSEKLRAVSGQSQQPSNGSANDGGNAANDDDDEKKGGQS